MRCGGCSGLTAPDHNLAPAARRPYDVAVLSTFPGFVPPCLPTKAKEPPCGGAWLHEIKHDGFRVIARKQGARVRLYSRNGRDLTHRFSAITLDRCASMSAAITLSTCSRSASCSIRSLGISVGVIFFMADQGGRFH
jgi:ATP-dependent DNA ligase